VVGTRGKMKESCQVCGTAVVVMPEKFEGRWTLNMTRFFVCVFVSSVCSRGYTSDMHRAKRKRTFQNAGGDIIIKRKLLRPRHCRLVFLHHLPSSRLPRRHSQWSASAPSPSSSCQQAKERSRSTANNFHGSPSPAKGSQSAAPKSSRDHWTSRPGSSQATARPFERRHRRLRPVRR
jgi:hypothetical protein